jgi:hypothetical protein
MAYGAGLAVRQGDVLMAMLGRVSTGAVMACDGRNAPFCRSVCKGFEVTVPDLDIIACAA